MSSDRERRRKLYITGFSSRDDEHDIKKSFKKYGKIDEVSWKGRFCFLTYKDSNDAERAIRKLNKETLHGHTLLVEFARSRGANDGSCYNCGKKGHFARDCSKRQKSSSSSSRSSRPRKNKKNKKASSSSSSSPSKSVEKKGSKDRSRSRSRKDNKRAKSGSNSNRNSGEKKSDGSKSKSSSNSRSVSKNNKKK